MSWILHNRKTRAAGHRMWAALGNDPDKCGSQPHEHCEACEAFFDAFTELVAELVVDKADKDSDE